MDVVSSTVATTCNTAPTQKAASAVRNTSELRRRTTMMAWIKPTAYSAVATRSQKMPISCMRGLLLSVYDVLLLGHGTQSGAARNPGKRECHHGPQPFHQDR